MSTITLRASLAVATAVSLSGLPALAATTIKTPGAAPFRYGGRTYVPLKSTARFLGAPVRWDARRGQSVLNYRGKDLAFKTNSREAMHAGRRVMLPSAAVSVAGVIYVPTEVFGRVLGVLVVWDGGRSQVRIMGPGGWGTMRATQPSWHGGPPPWAPAWGRRRFKGSGHPGNARSNGDGRPEEWVRLDDDAQGRPGNGKSNGNGRGNGKRKGW